MKYIATEDRITFHYNGTTTTLCRENNAYFDQLYNAVKHNKSNLEEYLPVYLVRPEEVSKRTNGRLAFDNGKLTSDYLYIPAGINDMIRTFLDDQMPLQPIVSFLENLSYNPSPSIQDELGTYLYQGKVPLTWDGGMICYARSSWLQHGDVLDWMERGFQAGQQIQGTELPCGTFNWATGQCPDQGRVYDLLVQPQHIQALSNEKMYVKEYVNVSALEETTDPERGYVIVTRLSPLGETVYVREPITMAHLSHYVASALATKNTEVKQPVGVAV